MKRKREDYLSDGVAKRRKIVDSNRSIDAKIEKNRQEALVRLYSKGNLPMRYFNGAAVPGEAKNLDGLVSMTALTTTATVYWPLCTNLNSATGGNGIATGTSKTTRIGNRIFLKSLHLKALLRLDNQVTAVPSSDLVRIIVGIDMQANGAMTAATDVLVSATASLSHRNLDQTQRFKILMDKYYTLNVASQNAATSNATSYRFVQKFFSFKEPIQVAYNGTTGDIGEVRSNNLFIIICDDLGFCSNKLQTRIRYSDT